MSAGGETGPLTRPAVVRARDANPDKIRELVQSRLTDSCPIFVTRASLEQYAAVLEVAPGAEYHDGPQLIVVGATYSYETGGSHRRVAIVAAGTSDATVAEEVAIAVGALGYTPLRIYDVGVAGMHRLLAFRDEIESATCIVVVAGMEGALASMVPGLTTRPVVGVPTSTGYGASLEGMAAWLAMIEASTTGLSVVAIDDGVAAALVAHRILRTSEED